jgi:hypothetical protein
VGELDPVVVIKLKEYADNPYTGERSELLGRCWIIVDGHHRLEAYRKNKHEKPILCEWFDGTAREAMSTTPST